MDPLAPIESLLKHLEARPGFSPADYDEIVPKLKRLMVIRDLRYTSCIGAWGLVLSILPQIIYAIQFEKVDSVILMDWSSRFSSISLLVGEAVVESINQRNHEKIEESSAANSQITGQPGFIHHVVSYLEGFARYCSDRADSVISRPPRLVNFPRTDQLRFIQRVVSYVEEVVVHYSDDADSIRHLIYEVGKLMMKMKLVCFSFMEIPKFVRDKGNSDDVLSVVTGLAYQVEYVIDEIIVTATANKNPHSYSMHWLIYLDHMLDKHWTLMKRKFVPKEFLRHEIFCEDPDHVRVFSCLSTDSAFRMLSSASSWAFPYLDTLTSSCHRILSFDAVLSCTIVDIGSISVKFEVTQGLSPLSCLFDCLHDFLTLMSEVVLGRRCLVIIVMGENENLQVLVDILRAIPENNNGSRILVITASQELILHIHSHPSLSLLLEALTRHQQPTPLQRIVNHLEDDVVGFQDVLNDMMGWLVRGRKRLQIASICGMAGQGKTTLANKLFKTACEMNYFHAFAWCVVSQVYHLKELLLELLGQVIVHCSSDSIHDKNEHELMEMLKKSLLQRKYFIVMDDVWDTKAWQKLERCFPDENYGSRILFTTRIKELASKARSGSIVHPLKPLSDKDSWQLLKKRLSQKGSSAPDDLESVGMEIAKNCNGSPLVVVVAAGLLSKLGKDRVRWNQIARTLSAQILGDSEAQCRALLELSYKHLPDHLKSCFLYLGAFVEDKVIPFTKVKRLWIAEGFVCSTSTQPDRVVKSSNQGLEDFLASLDKFNGEKSTFEPDISMVANSEQLVESLKTTDQRLGLEDLAEQYLMELFQRSLVLIVSKTTSGGVKSLKVHDLLRSFCLAKAKEESFLHEVNGYDEDFQSSLVHQDCLSKKVLRYDDHHRLSIYSSRHHFAMLKPSGRYVRSLLFSAAGDTFPTRPYDLSFISDNFKFVKILNLEDINIGNSFEMIIKLVHIKYLAIQCEANYIPSSISNLWNLETMVIRRVNGKSIKVPDSIWNMPKLRHVDIPEGDFDFVPYRFNENSRVSKTLHTLFTPSLAYGDDSGKTLARLSTIQKLCCNFLDSWDETSNCNRFPVLEFLNQLKSLKVFYKGAGIYPYMFNFPSNLTKLTLSGFRMAWSDISQISKLRSLVVLKLLRDAFEGAVWEMEDDDVAGFPKLRFLKLDTPSLITWSASGAHFPVLEQLVLHNCKQLSEIPESIGDIETLQRIEVMWCNRSAAESAREIKKDKQDFGNDSFKIHIYPAEWDEDSSQMIE